MTDFHAHILPGIDDGSKSIEESIELVKMLVSQGIETVIATPHYSIRYQSDSEFLQNREKAYKELISHQEEAMPHIVLGAEVEYFSGIGRSAFIQQMRIENTKLLLVEMPFEKWSDKVVENILQLCCSNDIIPVLAHIERYYKFADWQILDVLSENGVLFQMNCTAFTERKTAKKTEKLLSNGQIQFVGTDCHFLPGRFPQMNSFVSYITEKMGERFLQEFFIRQEQMLQG